jgi:hypothetical protein
MNHDEQSKDEPPKIPWWEEEWFKEWERLAYGR